MEPIQKKCLTVSAVAHGLLLVALVVCAAFVKPPQPREIIPIKYFSGKLVDSVLNSSGGAPRMVNIPNPNPTPAPPSPNPPTPNPPTPRTVTPPVTPPTMPSPPERTTAPPRTENNPPAKSKSKVTTTAPEPKKRRINTDLKTRSQATGKSATSKTDSADKTSKSSKTTSNQRLEAFNRTFSDLNNGLASGGGLTVSDVLGTGVGGGAGQVNYSQAVLGAYDDAWNPPPELNEDRAVVVIKIVVHRTGRIVRTIYVKRSNIHLMDLSVQNALEAVESLPPFPEGSKDLERTFTIEFNLKVKRGLG